MAQPDTVKNNLDGNTKKTSRLRKWFFTLNNYTVEEINTILEHFKEAKKYIFQEEKGENNTPHLQGCVEYENARSFESMKKINPKIHWEKTRNDQKAIEYCCKESTRNGQIWSKGITKKRNTMKNLITTLKPWQQDIEKLHLSEPDTRKIYWYWDEKGGCGKTALAKYLLIKYPEEVCYCTATKSADILTCTNEKYKTYILDFPRSNGDFFPWNAIEQLKNGMITDAKLKKEARCLIFDEPHVIIFANHEPEISKLSKDRWVIKNLD